MKNATEAKISTWSRAEKTEAFRYLLKEVGERRLDAPGFEGPAQREIQSINEGLLSALKQAVVLLKHAGGCRETVRICESAIRKADK